MSSKALFLSILSSDEKSSCNVNPKVAKLRCMILLLLMLSGNVETNPGPGLDCAQTPADFSSRSGLGIIHLNVRSLLPKIDFVRIWAQTSIPKYWSQSQFPSNLKF